MAPAKQPLFHVPVLTCRLTDLRNSTDVVHGSHEMCVHARMGFGVAHGDQVHVSLCCLGCMSAVTMGVFV